MSVCARACVLMFDSEIRSHTETQIKGTWGKVKLPLQKNRNQRGLTIQMKCYCSEAALSQYNTHCMNFLGFNLSKLKVPLVPGLMGTPWFHKCPFRVMRTHLKGPAGNQDDCYLENMCKGMLPALNWILLLFSLLGTSNTYLSSIKDICFFECLLRPYMLNCDKINVILNFS